MSRRDKQQTAQHWRDLAIKRGHEIERLQAENSALRRQLLTIRDDAEETGAAVTTGRDVVKRQRDQYRELALHLQHKVDQLAALLPMTIIDDLGQRELTPPRSDGRWQYSAVQAVVYARDASGPAFQTFTTAVVPYMGEKEAAAVEVGAKVQAAILPIPQGASGRKMPDIPVDYVAYSEHFYNALSALCLLTDTDDPQTVRTRHFDALLRDLPSDFVHDRREVNRRFTTWLNTALDIYANERQRNILLGAKLLKMGESE